MRISYVSRSPKMTLNVHAANGKPSIDSMVYEQCPADADAGDGN